jgi:hypothetical protein
VTGHSHRDRIEAAVEAHRDIQRSLRRQMVERDAAERARAHTRVDENVRAGRRILRRADETEQSVERATEVAVTPPRDQRPRRWLT